MIKNIFEIDIKELMKQKLLETGKLKAVDFGKMTKRIKPGQIAIQILGGNKEKLEEEMAQKGLVFLDFIFVSDAGTLKSVNLENKLIHDIVIMKTENGFSKYVILDLN